MMISTETSQLIRALRFFLIVGLVFVHFGSFPDSTLDPFTGVYNAEFVVASSLNSFLLYVFLCSVPILSAISGYLLCFSHAPQLVPALRKRALTIVLPAMMWTSLWLLLAFTLYTLGRSSGQFSYYNYGFDDFNILTLLNGIIGITEEPFALQFWFVHDLVLSIAISPLLYWLVKRVPLVLFGSMVVAWLFGKTPPVFFQLKVVFFFSIGIFLAQRNWQPKSSLSYGNVVLGVFLLLVAGRVFIPSYNAGQMPFEYAYELLLRVTGAYAILALMLNIRTWAPRFFTWLANHSGVAFFLHCAHFPPIIIFKQFIAKAGLSGSDTKLVALLLVTPLVTVVSIVYLAKLMQRFTPALYGFFNGQRNI